MPTPGEDSAAAAPTALSKRMEAARKVKRLGEDAVKYDGGDCEALGKASMKCLEEQGYDRSRAAVACHSYYEAYRNCKKARAERTNGS